MTKFELILDTLENAPDFFAARDALEDGEALGFMGLGDSDQAAVEEAHAALSKVCDMLKAEEGKTKEEIAEAEQQIKEIQHNIDNFDVADYLDYSVFDEWLDDVHGTVSIAGGEFNTSYALKEVDPTAYRCGFLDYCDGYDKENISEYVNLTQELENFENVVSDLEDKLEELKAIDSLDSLKEFTYDYGIEIDISDLEA